MMSKSQISKVNKKQKRCQVLISNELGISSSTDPTKFVAICNAGLATGLQEEEILKEALRYGSVSNIVMLPNKSYCFLECSSVDDAKCIFSGLHGKAELGQNNNILYLSYFISVPEVKSPWNGNLPNGLIIIPNFITEDEEILLMNVTSFPSEDTETLGKLKHRKVQHFGYEFLYGINNVDPDKPLERKIPEECSVLWSRLEHQISYLDWYIPNQLTVNEYIPGQGIPPHVDTHSAFLDPILSLSLASDIVMEFRSNENRVNVIIPRRSMLIMSGESRFNWLHGITPRHMDIIPTNISLTVKQREKRVSLTFRKIRMGPCNCNFPTLCDTKNQNTKKKSTDLIKMPSKLETDNVHNIYEQIAGHFSETRHSPWPRVSDFVNSFEIGTVILDIGCGNGKYLGINKEILEIGCDRSNGLLQLCKSNNYSIFNCDCLNVPFQENSIDGCISIAVIHHLSTPERRVQAIQEMARILKTGGKALIYVWAKNQNADNKKSSYLRQNKAVNKNKKTVNEIRELTTKKEYYPKTDIDLPIHANRTEFQDQDVFVPWKLKGNDTSKSSVFLRYYHVFEEHELDNLCKKIDSIKIVKTYYDQGNFCVIFEKI